VSNPDRTSEANEDGWPICELWDKYEQIAMHFNDLLIRLRTQALATTGCFSELSQPCLLLKMRVSASCACTAST
jgi:hypothetical protein